MLRMYECVSFVPFERHEVVDLCPKGKEFLLLLSRFGTSRDPESVETLTSVYGK